MRRSERNLSEKINAINLNGSISYILHFNASLKSKVLQWYGGVRAVKNVTNRNGDNVAKLDEPVRETANLQKCDTFNRSVFSTATCLTREDSIQKNRQREANHAYSALRGLKRILFSR